MFDLTGKTAFITGAARGLGKQFAHCLSNAGARVILTDINYEEIKLLASKIKNALALKMDIADSTLIKKVFKEIEQNKEKIDLCINNVGVAKWTPIFLDELDRYDSFEKGGWNVWNEVLQVNLSGTWLVTQHIAEHMRKYSIKGSIVNIASTLGDHNPVPGASASSVSKAGIIHLTKQLVPELARYGIRINCIIPGMFWSDLTRNQLQKREKEIKRKIPLGFVGKVDDFDGLILYFSSNQASSYVTGACVRVDGGASCHVELP